MKDKLIITNTFRITTFILIIIGVVAFIAGLVTDSQRTWSNYLIVNYYFFSLAIGAAFFLTLQYISQSGWSSGFIRIPEAMMAYIPFSAVFFLLIWFGVHDLYHWSHPGVTEHDPLLLHKSAYLNVPFFFIRLVIFFALWIFFTMILMKISVKTDTVAPESVMKYFDKNELYSKIFIFIFALTFSASSFDWIMSLEPHWYSTIFALKNVVAAFLHGTSIVTLIVIILYRLGYIPFLNKYHLHDFSRYIFMLSIVWGYFWFAQFMIIWYGNIPEETVYYYTRWQNGLKILFWLEIILNWAVPFFILLPVKNSRRMNLLTMVIIILIAGQYVDLYYQVIPATTGLLKFGLIEAGMFVGFAGLFALVVATALSRNKIIPVNHPYLDESKNHRFN